MREAAEQIAKQFANAANVRNIWSKIVINVKEYGAIGDGISDDTAAMQSAVNYAVSIGKKDIWIPAGTYKYGVLLNTDGITFYGDGVTLEGETKLEVVSFHSLIERFADTANNNNIKFFYKLMNGEVTKIKLIGDSITEGVGAKVHISPPPDTQPLIFDNGVEKHYEGDYESRCWANYFREYVQAHFPSIHFVNAGIGGKDAIFANANKQYWVDNDEDVLFVMLGTNNRNDTELTAFEQNLEEFLEYANARSKLMIVMTAQPTENDAERLHGMDEIDNIITKICRKHNYIHISHYREMLDYIEKSGTVLSSLIQAYGSHPNDRGYLVMWKILQQNLGFIDTAVDWEDGSFGNITVAVRDDLIPAPIASTTPITDRIFKPGKYTVYELTNSDAANFPEGTQGTLITWRGWSNDLYSYQVWKPRQSLNEYKRYWIFASGVWSSWHKTNFDIYYNGAVARTATTPLTDYPIGQTQFVDITSGAGFPENSQGTLETYRGKVNDLFSYQRFITRDTKNIYVRFWDFLGSVWGSWRQVAVGSIKNDLTVTGGSVAANSVLEVLVVPQSMYQVGQQHLFELIGNIPSGIIHSVHLNNSSNRYVVRFYNPTASAITIPNLTLRVTQLHVG